MSQKVCRPLEQWKVAIPVDQYNVFSLYYYLIHLISYESVGLLIIAILSIIGSVLFVAIVAVTIVVVSCFAMGKRRRSTNMHSSTGTASTYQFTPNVTYNIREQVMSNEDRHSESSGIQSSALHYDYIPTTRRAMPLSEHHIASSSANRNAI